jgi:DHA3 family tetracycline resistance protein-like MFS transporter
VTLFQVALLAAVFEATIILFEIPTGLFADRFGRKLSTSVGFFGILISGIIFLSVRNFGGFLAAEIVFGISETFISGALEALAVDSLRQTEKDTYLPRLFSNRTIFRTSAMVVSMVGGGFLASRFLPYLFAPFIILAILGTIFSFYLTEPPRNLILGSGERTRKGISAVFHFMNSSKIIMAIFVVGIFSNLAFEGVDQYWQVLFSEMRGIGISYFGLMTAAGALIVIAIMRLAEKYFNRLDHYLMACFVLLAAGIFLATRFSVYPAVAGIIAYFVIKELISPALSTYLNRSFAGADRATFLSSYNLCCSVGEVAAGIGVGLLAGERGVTFVFYFSAAVALVVPMLFMVIKRKISINE